MPKKSLIEKAGGIDLAKQIIGAIPDPEAKYYVLEKNLKGETGFYASAFHVGIHNRHTHINLEQLKTEIEKADSQDKKIWISASEQIQIGSEKWQKELLATDYIEDMGGDCRIISDKAVKARKSSTPCTFCLNPTLSGTYVRVMSIAVDGEIVSHRYCEDCCNAMILQEYVTDSKGYHEGHSLYNEDDDDNAWDVREQVRYENQERGEQHA